MYQVEFKFPEDRYKSQQMFGDLHTAEWFVKNLVEQDKEVQTRITIVGENDASA